jgi:phage tail-like protein
VRGSVAGEVNPLPVGARLPGVLVDDDVARHFCAGMDEVLAPIVVALDCFPAYLDPLTTPADLLPWLADWLGLDLDPNESVARQRHLLRKTATSLKWRGTLRGLRDAVEFVTGISPEIEEPGASEWSATAGAALPGQPGGNILVRLRTDDPDAIDLHQAEETAAAAVPAHLRCLIEVLPPA